MAESLLYRVARAAYRKTKYTILPWAGHQVVRHRSPHQIVSTWPEGEFPLGPKVCIFVHWDGAGEVRDHVLNYLRALNEAGISTVFVTNAGALQPQALAAIKPLCAAIVIRRNVGYDFGAWREGLERAALPRPDTTMVLLANDSLYGPIRSLNQVFDTIDFGVADVWGCTESWQSRYHIQSYMIAFSPKVVASQAWRDFWAGVRPTWSKVWLIRMYEIGLTQMLLRSGFTCRAIWPYEALIADLDLPLLDLDEHTVDGPSFSDPIVRARQRHALHMRQAIALRYPLNPTSDLWRQLLRARFPFLKRELLRDNPSNVADVVEWREQAAEIADRSLDPIERDLRRTLKNRAP